MCKAIGFAALPATRLIIVQEICLEILPISDFEEHRLLVIFAGFSLIGRGVIAFVLFFLEPRPFVLARGALKGGSSINCFASNSSFLLTWNNKISHLLIAYTCLLLLIVQENKK